MENPESRSISVKQQVAISGSKVPVLRPSKFAHVVLQTADLNRMIDFYTTFLGGWVVHRGTSIAFITFDDEHHRVALICMPELQTKDEKTCGLNHIAFTYDSLADLFESYCQRQDLGMKPVRCLNHGPTTSLYYQDPDGNRLELQVDNFENADDATTFMNSEAFAENPIGIEFDPDDMMRRLQAGEEETKLKKRADLV